MVIRSRQVSIYEFEHFLEEHPDGLYELIDGEIVEKLPTEEHAHIAGIFAGEFHIHLKQHPELKARFGVEGRFRPEDDESNDRMTDVFFRFTNTPRVRQGAVLGIPDIAVEIKSPRDSYRRMREKAEYYLQNGCRLVWLVYPEKKMIEVYPVDSDIQILLAGDILDGGDILPDFRLNIADLFEE